MLSYQHVCNDRQWRATTGLTKTQFELLARYFGETYEFFHGLSISQLANNIDVEIKLASYPDCLFFVLFQLKSGLSYDSLGLLIQTDGSNAQRCFEKYLHLLELTLERQGVMPRRNFSSPSEFEAYLKEDKDISLDGSEQPTQRPADEPAQKQAFSGKKNAIPIRS
ncbi:hypothetical protein GCM10028808_33920 [Spirosoma migulaei]